MNRKLNKKGFTFSELIVVIVIIGILALVLIPTLTGYIKKAKESAAEQEAASYINAYNAWQIETGEDDLYLEGFLNYCVELELFDNLYEAKESIIAVDVNEKSFIVKASNDLYVKYLNGTLNVLDENPIAGLIENRVNFNDNVVKANLSNINSKFTGGEAEIAINKVYADGSVDVIVSIQNSEAVASNVVGAVVEAINTIKNNGGKSINITPIINGEEMSVETYKNKVISLYGKDAEAYFPMNFDTTTTYNMAYFAAQTFVYKDGISVEQWDETTFNLTVSPIINLVEENQIKITANIEDASGAYTVAYYFTFVDGTN